MTAHVGPPHSCHRARYPVGGRRLARLSYALVVALLVMGCLPPAEIETPASLGTLAPFLPDQLVHGALHGSWSIAPPVFFDDGGALRLSICHHDAGSCFGVSLVCTTSGFKGMHHTDHFDILTDSDAGLVAPDELSAILGSLAGGLRSKESWQTPLSCTLGRLERRLVETLAVAGGTLSTLDVPDMPAVPEEVESTQPSALTMAWKIWIPLGWLLVTVLLGTLLGRMVGLRRRGRAPVAMAPGALGRLATPAVVGVGVGAALLVGVVLRLGLGSTAIPNWTFFTTVPFPPDVSALYSYLDEYDVLHPPLLQWVAWLVTLGGEGPSMLASFRAISLVSSMIGLVCSVMAIVWLFRSKTALLLGSVLVALFPVAIDMVRYNEAYAFSYGASAVAIWALARARATGSLHHMVVSGVTAGLLAWTAYPKAFVVPALLVMGIVGGSARLRFRQWLPWIVVVGMLVAPLLPRVYLGASSYVYGAEITDDMVVDIQGNLTGTPAEEDTDVTPLAVMLLSALSPTYEWEGEDTTLTLVTVVIMAALTLLVLLAAYARRGPPGIRVVLLGVVTLVTVYTLVGVVMPLRVPNILPAALLVIMALAAVPDNLPGRWLPGVAGILVVAFMVRVFFLSEVVIRRLTN